MSLYLGENLVSGVALPIEPTRNIGQIIQSTIPLTDAGLHLLDGSVIQGDGIYSGFVNYIKNLYDGGEYTTIFETENNWQTSILNYGVCGKFVYTAASGNNPATVRLPKITGFVEGANGVSVLGNVVEAGLPNITGSTKSEVNFTKNPEGALNISDSYGYSFSVTSGNQYSLYRKLEFDASLSNSIYGNSDTVQPQSVKVLYYIVIAASTKTEIEVDIDEIATDLNNKVNVSDLIEVQSVIETYNNEGNWYRVWSDGWIEQGGIKSATSQTSITLLKQFSDTNYTVTGAITDSTSATGNNSIVIGNITSSGFTIYSVSKTRWYACGY